MLTTASADLRRWFRPSSVVVAVAACVYLATASASGQRTDVFVESRDHPAIAYGTSPVHDAVTALNDRLRQGTAHLAFDAETGYLKSTLAALNVPVQSQALVFSQTSAQAARIGPRNPRAIYFNDTVQVGWVRGADILEVAAEDPRQGVVFYTLEQRPAAKPAFARQDGCLECHLTWDTLGVPGIMVLSTFRMSDDPHEYASGLVVDHRTPIDRRWGGWYVTGTAGTTQHLGNVPVIVPAAELAKPKQPTPRLDSIEGLVDAHDYLSTKSDVVALMVLEHQTRMTNLLTRIGWEARVASHSEPAAAAAERAVDVPARVADAARELVDYMLFVREAPLAGRVVGSSGFAEYFSAQGPRDSKGRSLRQLDLEKRLMRYPCSYMIYAPAFDALPAVAKEAVYARMWRVLSGEEAGKAYARLAADDRRAIVEILRDTKKDLPPYFTPQAIH
jgi:hypothetical protein